MIRNNDEQLSSKVQFAYNSAIAAANASSSSYAVSDHDIISLLGEYLYDFDILSITMPKENKEKLHSENVPAFSAELLYGQPSPFFFYGNFDFCISADDGGLSGLTKTELYLYLFAYQTFGQAGADVMAECIIDGSQSGSAV